MQDAIYVEPMTSLSGKTVTASVCLKNIQSAAGYNFDLVLPDGFSIATDATGKLMDELSERHADHTKNSSYKGENTYGFATLSGNSEEFSGNEGVIRKIRLSVSEGVEVGHYPLIIRNARYSTPAGASVRMEDVQTSIVIESGINGDVNGDGEVDIADAVCIVNHIVDKPVVNFVEKHADVNGDDDIDIADAVTIVNYIVGKTSRLYKRQQTRIPQ